MWTDAELGQASACMLRVCDTSLHELAFSVAGDVPSVQKPGFVRARLCLQTVAAARKTTAAAAQKASATATATTAQQDPASTPQRATITSRVSLGATC